MKFAVPIFFILLFIPTPAYLETMYIREDIQVMVRTDPGPKRRIVAMPKSGTRVEVLKESEDGWSKIRLPDEKEGWLLTHYLSQGPPTKRVIAELKRENEVLKQRVKALGEENPLLKSERKDLQKALSEQTESAEALRASYEKLKRESSEFLSLQAAHEKASKDLAVRTKRQVELEEKVKDLQNTQTLRWFLAGAVVLFVGFIVGYMSRRPKRRPSLL